MLIERLKLLALTYLMLAGCNPSSQTVSEEVETPYITVTKFLSAQLYGDVAAAREFIDPLQLFKEANNDTLIADSLLAAQVALVRRYARDNRLPSLLAIHKCRLVQQVDGNMAKVSFMDKVGPRERVRFTLQKLAGDRWVIVGIEFNLITNLGK